MKKLICAVWISLFWIGTALAVSVPEDVAKQVAANWLTERTGRLVTPDDAASVLPTVGENGQTTYFSVAFAPEGWVIIAADDVAYPVIGYSPTGHFQPVSEQRPPSFSGWMAGVEADIAAAVRRRSSPLPETFLAWERLAVSTSEFRPIFSRNTRGDPVVGPLIQTRWGQGTYYNAACPEDLLGPGGHVVTGCGATAMAQLMKFHTHPASGYGSKSYTSGIYGLQTVNFGQAAYNWGAMPNNGPLQDYDADVAELMYHCAVSVEMDFGPGGSSSSLRGAAEALANHFRYETPNYLMKSDWSDSEWDQMLKDELNAGRPVLYRGEGTGGHGFICDGYDDSAPTQFHFNWGWNGLSDGYFFLDSLTPHGENYSSVQEAVFGVKPAEPVNLTLPYSEGFEGGVPQNWTLTGTYAQSTTAESRSGSSALLLGSVLDPDTDENAAFFKIDVPSSGAILRFWVKRGYSPQPTQYGDHSVAIRPEFGDEVLREIFNGDFNDADWQQFEVDLSPWQGMVIRVYFEQVNNSSAFTEWMYVDDIGVSGNGESEEIVWVASKSEAVSMALAQGKSILLMAGRPTCPNCQYMKSTVCESNDPPIRDAILSGFIPWFCDVDESDEWHPYASGLGPVTLPLICRIDPGNPDQYLDRSTGVQEDNEFYDRLRSLGVEKGDVNHRDGVNLQDAILALQTAVGVSSGDVFTDADVNDDTRIGIIDAVYILQKVARLR